MSGENSSSASSNSPNNESQSGDPGRTPGSAEGDEATIDEDLRDKEREENCKRRPQSFAAFSHHASLIEAAGSNFCTPQMRKGRRPFDRRAALFLSNKFRFLINGEQFL
jgi:hypothetical protein